MALRITPMRPIERGGLKGFGFSVFIDNSPETANQSVQSQGATVANECAGTSSDKNPATVPVAEQSAGEGQRDRQHVPSRMTDDARHGGQDQFAAALDHAPNSHSSRPSSPETDKTGEDGTPPTSSSVAPSPRKEA